MFHIIKIVLLILGGPIFSGTAALFAEDKDLQAVCKNIKIQAPQLIRFSDSEKTFICGDKNVEAWSEIPFPQFKIHLRAILQSKGYHDPKFIETKSGLIVQLSQKKTLKTIEINGEPEEIEFNYNQNLIGESLTPEILDRTKSWIKAKLSDYGYACAEIEIRGLPQKEAVLAKVKDNGLRKIRSIQFEKKTRLHPKTFQRYYLLQPGDTFDSLKLELTSRRLQSDAGVESHQFGWECLDKDEIDLISYVIEGEPRLFKIGIGFSTEEYLLFRMSWENTRLDSKASTIEAFLSASFIEQKIGSHIQWFFLEPESHFFLLPSVKLSHRHEHKFEALDSRSGVSLGHFFDSTSMHFTWRVGPEFADSRILSGKGPGSSQFILWKSLFTMMSHEFEYFQRDPRQGFRWSISSEISPDLRISDFSAYQFKLSGEHLYPLFHWEPPLMILGFRVQVRQTLTQNQTDRLPIDFRYFLGGAQNLRGYSRNEIPKTAEGALSSVDLGAELRFPIAALEPLLFFDAGVVGARDFDLDLPLFMDAGIGLRWLSPVGVFRGTLAHGFYYGQAPSGVDDLSHIQWYLNYGMEF